MNNLLMVISILGGLTSLALRVVLLISLFAEKLKPLRRKLTIALVTAVILCIVGGTMHEINPEDKARIDQETEAKKEAETKAQVEEEEEEADRIKAEADRVKTEEKAKKKAEEEETKRLKAEKEAKASEEQEQKAQAKKEIKRKVQK